LRFTTVLIIIIVILEFALSSTVDNMFTMTPTSDSGLDDATTSEKTADTTATPTHNELDCRTFTFVVYVVLFGLLLVCGLIGNTLSFIVLQFDRHSHAATFLLQVAVPALGLAFQV